MKKVGLIIFIVLIIILTLFIGYYIYEINTSKVQNKVISEKINYLDIDVEVVDLIVRKGEEFKIETDNKYIRIKEYNSKLSIEEREHFFKTNHNNLIIYIPDNYLFENIELDAGVGKVDISSFISNKIDFDLGVGDVVINNLIVNEYIEIESGVGKLNIFSGTLNNLDLDSGVGKVNISSNLLGNSKIDAGVGSINLDILNTIENYKFIITKGIGNTKLNGKSINTNIYGNGINTVTISGGLGTIDINTTNN